MGSRRFPLRTRAIIAGLCVLGAAATVVACLGCIVGFGVYMDVHGVTVAMRFAAVAVVAVAITPPAVAICQCRLDRINTKRDKAQLAALNFPRHAAHSPRRAR